MFAPAYRDIVITPLFVVSNLLLILASWRLARRFFPDDDEDHLVVHSIVVGWAGVLGSAVVLGSVGALSGVTLTAVVALGAGLVLYQVRRDRSSPSAGNTGGCFVVSVCGFTKYIYISFIILYAVNGLGRFPDDWDTLMYHLSRIDQWIQRGSLFASDSYNWSHPGNNELIGLWMVAPFTGDFLISLNNLPAVGLLGFGSIALGRSLGLSRGLSYLTAAAIVSNAVVFRQLLDAKNDLAVAGLFAACLNYGLRAARSDRIAELVWGGLSIGLLAGAKYNALGYAALVFATAAPIVAVSRGLRSAAVMSAIWSSCLILWGGLWYIRNAIMVGNPLYPMGVTRESNILAVIYPELQRSSFWGCGRLELLPLAVDAVARLAGPAYLVAILATPLSVAWLASSGVPMGGDGSSKLDVWIRGGLVLWMVGSGILLLVTPLSVEDTPDTLNHLRDGYTPVRFGLCFLSISLLALSVVIQDLSRDVGCLMARLEMRVGRRAPIDAGSKAIGPPRWMSRRISSVPLLLWGAIVAVQCITQIRRSIDDFVFHLLVSVVLVEAVWLLRLSRGLGPWTRHGIDVALILALGVGISGACGRLSTNWHRNYAHHYDDFFNTGFFDRLSVLRPRPERVYVLFYRAYPFHGSRREFRVFQPMWIPSRRWLLEDLEDKRADILVLAKRYPLYDGWKNYDVMINENFRGEQRWQSMYGDASFEIFLRVPRRRSSSDRAETVIPRPGSRLGAAR